MSELPGGGIVRRVIASLSWDTPAHIALANVAASAIALITAPIIARSIGAAGRGETAAALAAFALVPIVLAIGMPIELRRVWATARADSLVRSFRDVAAIMAGHDGPVAPFFVDADATPNPGGLPVGGLTVVAFRNSHLTYALTWFALAAGTLGAAFLVWRHGRR